MSGFLIVLRKECTDNIRDRRTIISSFSLALLGPALFVGLMAFVLNTALGSAFPAGGIRRHHRLLPLARRAIMHSDSYPLNRDRM